MSKIVLITGASSGIGYETALALARQGHKVYAAARRVELMEPLTKEGIVVMHMDVTKESSMEECVKQIFDVEHRIDVLINNAGYGYFGPVETVLMEDARRQLEVNVFGLASLCRKVIPIMRRNGGGRIINTSSIAGKLVFYFGGWYNVSKFAVEALSDAMRMELKPFGIDVVLIEPGGIRTNWGIIAAQNLAESTKGTAYEVAAFNEAQVLNKAYSVKFLSEPETVSKTIVKAVKKRRPRPRYRVGVFSNSAIFLRAIVSTRVWDSIMRQISRIKCSCLKILHP